MERTRPGYKPKSIPLHIRLRTISGINNAKKGSRASSVSVESSTITQISVCGDAAAHVVSRVVRAVVPLKGSQHVLAGNRAIWRAMKCHLVHCIQIDAFNDIWVDG